MRRQRETAKQGKTLRVEEDFRVPGTNVILEAGDRFQVMNEVADLWDKRVSSHGARGRQTSLAPTIMKFVKDFDKEWGREINAGGDEMDVAMEFLSDLAIELSNTLGGEVAITWDED